MYEGLFSPDPYAGGRDPGTSVFTGWRISDGVYGDWMKNTSTDPFPFTWFNKADPQLHPEITRPARILYDDFSRPGGTPVVEGISAGTAIAPPPGPAAGYLINRYIAQPFIPARDARVTQVTVACAEKQFVSGQVGLASALSAGSANPTWLVPPTSLPLGSYAGGINTFQLTGPAFLRAGRRYWLCMDGTRFGDSVYAGTESYTEYGPITAEAAWYGSSSWYGIHYNQDGTPGQFRIQFTLTGAAGSDTAVSAPNSLGTTPGGAPWLYPQYNPRVSAPTAPINVYAYQIADYQATVTPPVGGERNGAAVLDAGSHLGSVAARFTRPTSTGSQAAGVIANATNIHREFTQPYDQMLGYIFNFLISGTGGSTHYLIVQRWGGDFYGGKTFLSDTSRTLPRNMHMQLDVTPSEWPDVRLVARMNGEVIYDGIDSGAGGGSIGQLGGLYQRSNLFGFYINTAGIFVDDVSVTGYPFVPPPPVTSVLVGDVRGTRSHFLRVS